MEMYPKTVALAKIDNLAKSSKTFRADPEAPTCEEAYQYYVTIQDEDDTENSQEYRRESEFEGNLDRGE
eukprot:3239249-Alexandrium_andersonii.AAC.1